MYKVFLKNLYSIVSFFPVFLGYVMPVNKIRGRKGVRGI